MPLAGYFLKIDLKFKAGNLIGLDLVIFRMVDDLHRLVTQSSSQPRPFILVGSELGALVARFYTQSFER